MNAGTPRSTGYFQSNDFPDVRTNPHPNRTSPSSRKNTLISLLMSRLMMQFGLWSPQPVGKIYRFDGYEYAGFFGFIKNVGDRIDKVVTFLHRTEEAGVKSIIKIQGVFSALDILVGIGL